MRTVVYLACTDSEVDPLTPGPWRELKRVAAGMTLIDSDQSLSRIYHELKWSLPEQTSLLVAPLTSMPKLSRYAPGTTSWLRSRLASDGELVSDGQVESR